MQRGVAPSGAWVRAARRRSWHAAGHTVAQSLRQLVCSHCLTSESRGRRQRGVYVCVHVARACVCVAAASSKMPTLLRHNPYLFMGSLLSPVVAQGDHLQSHLHNDNNKVAWSGCECVWARVQTHVFMCFLAPSIFSIHSSVHPRLISCFPLAHSNTYPNQSPFPRPQPFVCLPETPLHPFPAPSSLDRAPTHMPCHDPVDTPQTAGAQPTLTIHWTKGDDCITHIVGLLAPPPKPTPHQPIISSHATLGALIFLPPLF